MNNEMIVNSLISKRKQIEKYFLIMKLIKTIDVEHDENFQKNFNAFYRLRRNEEFRKIYYKYLNDNKNRKDITFEEIFKYIKNKTGRYEASFSSKLLATINSEMPIWDSIVLKQLNLNVPSYNDSDREQKILNVYKDLQQKIKKVINEENYAEIFDSVFENKYDEYGIKKDDISKLKKIDFVLWSVRK